VEFSIKNGNPEKQRTDCVIVGVFEGQKLTDSAKSIDLLANKALSAVLKNGDMEGKLNSTLVLHNIPEITPKRVLLVGLGKPSEFTEKQYRQAVRAAIKALPKGVADASVYLPEIAINNANIASKVSHLVEVTMDATYQVNAIKSKKPEPKALTKIAVHVEKADNQQAEVALKQGLAISAGVGLAKDLGNLPPNICTPTYLGEQAKN